jgi:hypothetical protein
MHAGLQLIINDGSISGSSFPRWELGADTVSSFMVLFFTS